VWQQCPAFVVRRYPTEMEAGLPAAQPNFRGFLLCLQGNAGTAPLTTPLMPIGEPDLTLSKSTFSQRSAFMGLE
jgi:hypothetical protein